MFGYCLCNAPEDKAEKFFTFLDQVLKEKLSTFHYLSSKEIVDCLEKIERFAPQRLTQVIEIFNYDLFLIGPVWITLNPEDISTCLTIFTRTFPNYLAKLNAYFNTWLKSRDRTTPWHLLSDERTIGYLNTFAQDAPESLPSIVRIFSTQARHDGVTLWHDLNSELIINVLNLFGIGLVRKYSDEIIKGF